MSRRRANSEEVKASRDFDATESKEVARKRSNSRLESFKNYMASIYYGSQAQLMERNNKLDKATELFNKAMECSLKSKNHDKDVAVLHFNLGLIEEKRFCELIQSVKKQYTPKPKRFSSKYKAVETSFESSLSSLDVSNSSVETGDIQQDPVPVNASLQQVTLNEPISPQLDLEGIVLREFNVKPFEQEQIENFATRRSTIQLSPLAFLLQGK